MRIALTREQAEYQASFRAFVKKEIFPFADRFDQEECLPAQTIERLAEAGYLGAIIPKESGGLGMDMISFGLLNEEIGKACSSVRSLLTVQSMVAYAILKWGSREQRISWLPKLASGKAIGAFGLTEPNVGSDAKQVETTARSDDAGFVLHGRKQWITFGQIAHVFLIFAQCNGNVSAFLVERERPGLSTIPIHHMLGTRASMLAEIHLENCAVPRHGLVGGQGFGWAGVAATALDLGRYSVAWGCVGIAQACLEAAVEYARSRKQFGELLIEHQLVQRMLAEMATNVKAARLLCYQAGYSKDNGDPNSVMDTCIAKYFASNTCAEAASDAVQIYGANGCSHEYPVQRYFRDAKVMGIIEGSREIQQIIIAKYAMQEDA